MPHLPDDSRARLQKLLSDPTTYALTLILIVLDRYGTEALEWAPGTVADELDSDLQVRLPELLVAKISVANTLLTTDRFFWDLGTFNTVCNVLSDSLPTPGVVMLPDAAEIGWGITEGLLIYPPDQDEPFSVEIRKYIGHVCQHEGLLDPPDVLGIGIAPRPRVDHSLAPDIHQSVAAAAKSRQQAIATMIRENLQQLLVQLSGVPLENGDPRGLLDHVQRGLSLR